MIAPETPPAPPAQWETPAPTAGRADLLQTGQTPRKIEIAARGRAAAADSPAYAPTPPRDGAAGHAPRFRVEVAASTSDRQPSSASRLGVATAPVLVYQFSRNVSSLPPFPPPPPPPAFPTPVPGDGSNYSAAPGGSATIGEGARPNVRSWSSGLDLGLDFAPRGLENDAWRFSGGLVVETATTKSDMVDASGFGYQVVAPLPAPTLHCFQLSIERTCYYDRNVNAIGQLAVLPNTALRAGTAIDATNQTLDTVEARFGVGRAFALNRGLRVRLGVEVTGGRWSVNEDEFLQFVMPDNVMSYTYARDVDGPTASAQFKASLQGHLAGSVRWSINGAYGRRTADLTYDSVLTYLIGPGNPSVTTSSTVKSRDDGAIGSLGARLDLVHGPWNLFAAVDRRRDLTITTTVSSPGGVDRASAVFSDGSAAILSPVYSTRLQLGAGYAF